ncbi:MAG: Ribosomal small subunit methyltransferase [Pseudomonadota bacterium]|jgi:16S rRNA (uracil1498-N3)-methyltransferase
MARFYCDTPLVTGQTIALPATAARHVQVLRMQPGHTLTLFNGEGGEFEAEVTHMGRSDVQVRVGMHSALEREALRAVQLVVGMPANERMDWLVEKATELGVQRITPVMTERSVVRLNGERAEKKQAHWQAIAISACEQCGRNRVPHVDVPLRLEAWLSSSQNTDQQKNADGSAALRAVMSLHESTQALSSLLQNGQVEQVATSSIHQPVVLLTGPEGGLSDAEDAAARQAGFVAVSLGARVLRAETAALAALAYLTLRD